MLRFLAEVLIVQDSAFGILKPERDVTAHLLVDGDVQFMVVRYVNTRLVRCGCGRTGAPERRPGRPVDGFGFAERTR